MSLLLNGSVEGTMDERAREVDAELGERALEGGREDEWEEGK